MDSRKALSLWSDKSKRAEIRKVLTADGHADIVKRLENSASSAAAEVELANLVDKPKKEYHK